MRGTSKIHRLGWIFWEIFNSWLRKNAIPKNVILERNLLAEALLLCARHLENPSFGMDFFGKSHGIPWIEPRNPRNPSLGFEKSMGVSVESQKSIRTFSRLLNITGYFLRFLAPAGCSLGAQNSIRASTRSPRRLLFFGLGISECGMMTSLIDLTIRAANRCCLAASK